MDETRTSWKFKSCPRCNGDLYIEKDLKNNYYENCLQCGFTRDLKGYKVDPKHSITGIRRT